MKKSETIQKQLDALEEVIHQFCVDTQCDFKDPKYKELRYQERTLNQQLQYWERKEIKKYANHHAYTDIEPYEVVRIVSENCVEVRAMKTTQTKFPQDVRPGGFAGHTVDNREGQDYKYESNPDATPFKIRWSEANRQWQKGAQVCFIMSDRPYKFYDYNF